MTDIQRINATRLEIIDENGRAYSRWDIDRLEVSVQDGGRTVKLFVNRNFTGGRNETD